MAQSCPPVNPHFPCFRCRLPCVVEISHGGDGETKSLVILPPPTNMLLISPIIALFARSLSSVQAPSGRTDPAGPFQRWKDGWGETWRWRVSHPRFDDRGNGRVKWGPEKPEKMRGASRSPSPRFRLFVLVLPKRKTRRVEVKRNEWRMGNRANILRSREKWEVETDR